MVVFLDKFGIQFLICPIFIYFSNMIARDINKKITALSKKFKAVAIVGPRQSGKTTVAKTLFKTKPYISLENIDQRNFAKEDTRGFLSQFPNGAILDEVQRVPEIFSY
jgi:predicted AAA+ superfamily ATPase